VWFDEGRGEFFFSVEIVLLLLLLLHMAWHWHTHTHLPACKPGLAFAVQCVPSELGYARWKLEGWVERAFHELAYLLPSPGYGQSSCVLDSGYWLLCDVCWILDSGFWVLGHGVSGHQKVLISDCVDDLHCIALHSIRSPECISSIFDSVTPR
jgi:hypothetical protein